MGADRPARGAGCARRAGWALAVAIALGLVLPALAASAGRAEPQALIGEYIAAWKAFYPDRAFAYGDAASAAAFADYSPPRVSQWLQANEHAARGAQALLSAGDLPPATRTDLRVLAMRSRDELATWAEDRPLRQQPQWYAEQVSQALTYLLVRDQLSERARSTALVARLRGVVRLCEQGLEALVDGNALRTERALDVLAAARDFFAGGLR